MSGNEATKVTLSVNSGKPVSLDGLAKKLSTTVDVEVLESKAYAKAEKLVGGLTAKHVTEKTPEQLKEFISATAAFLQKEKNLMEEDAAVKAAKNTLAEKRRELREATKEQKALLELAILTYSKQI
ncbi:MAG: hypothetical protein QXL01_00795 [Thermoplasmatales archaeon]